MNEPIIKDYLAKDANGKYLVAIKNILILHKINTNVLYDLLKRHNIPLRGKIDATKVVDDYLKQDDNGNPVYTVKQIADMNCISILTMYNILRKFKVKTFKRKHSHKKHSWLA